VSGNEVSGNRDEGAPRAVPPLYTGGTPRSFPGQGRVDEGESSSLRSRWTLALAAMGSVLLLGGAVLFWRDAGPGSSAAPPVADLPGPWQPPTVPVGDTSVPVLGDLSASGTAPVTPTGARAPATGDGEAPEGTTPAVPDPAEPTVTPSVTVSRSGVPGTVDLAAGGSRDWVHWGLTNATSIDRKAGGTGEIKDLGGAARGRYDNNPTLFRWTGGAPTGSAGPSPTGVYACGRGSGFTISAAASPTARTLRFYAGVWMARGQLTLSVAGRTATASLENQRDITTTQFVIRFRAPAGQTLRVTWTTAEVFNPTCGNVDMQAAILS
jgi:hypothetical protein